MFNPLFMEKKGNQKIFTCVQTAIQIFVFAMVLIKQHQILKTYLDKRSENIDSVLLFFIFVILLYRFAFNLIYLKCKFFLLYEKIY